LAKVENCEVAKPIPNPLTSVLETVRNRVVENPELRGQLDVLSKIASQRDIRPYKASTSHWDVQIYKERPAGAPEFELGRCHLLAISPSGYFNNLAFIKVWTAVGESEGRSMIRGEDETCTVSNALEVFDRMFNKLRGNT